MKEPSRSFHNEGILANSTSFRVLLISDVNHLKLGSRVLTTRVCNHIWKITIPWSLLHSMIQSLNHYIMNPYMKENNSMMFIWTPLEDCKHEITMKETIDKSLILISSWLMIVLTLYSLHFNSDIIVFPIRILLHLFLIV